MFINESTDCNILRYSVESREAVDEFAMRVLKQGEIKGVFVPGISENKNGTFLLIPVSNSVPLEEYLRLEAERTGGFNSIKDAVELIRQAIYTEDSCHGYMLGNSVLIKNIKYAYVTDGSLCLICLPVEGAAYESDSDRSFFRSILSSGVYSDSDWNTAAGLINFVNSDEFSRDEFLFMINSIIESKVPHRAENELGKTDWLKKLKDFFKTGTAKSDTAETQTVRTAPSGIYMLAVRSTLEEYPICFGPDFIGRDENVCSICFPENNAISETHCKVYFDRNKFYLVDLDSELGTYLNNEKIPPNKPKAIVPGDLIRVGSEELVFSKRIPV